MKTEKTKKRIRKALMCLAIIMAGFICCAWVCAAGEKDFRIEQVHMNMPDMKVYLYPGAETIEKDKITAVLNEEKLTVTKAYPFSKDKKGTDYYILIDISKSISKEYFNSMKQAVLQFQNGISDKDTLTLISFGDQVSVLADKVGRNDSMQAILDNLDNNDDNTHLFEAFDKVSELADNRKSIWKRYIAIVISDGEDCSTNEKTKSEALEQLQKIGIPVYAMAVKETASGAANAFVEEFSDFARASNGSLSLFGKEEATACIEDIRSILNSAYVLQLKASSNRITSVMQPLTVSIGGSSSAAIQVCPRYSKDDSTPPTAELLHENDNELSIIFSEDVLNAENSSNYKVTLEGELLPIYAFNYDSVNKTALLTFSEPLQDGDYTVQLQNITDNSMKQNPFSGELQINIKNETPAPSEEPAQPDEEKTQYNIEVILICIAVVIILLILVIVLVVKKKKKGKASEPEFMQSTLSFTIRGEKGMENRTAVIHDKLLVGRSASCDISLMDQLLSRQHFEIEKESGSFYITNLSNTNKTKVNGIEITNRCKLKNGDVVQAGSLHITVNW